MLASVLRLAINLAYAVLIPLVAFGDRGTLDQLATLLPSVPYPGTVVDSAPGSITLQADRRGHFLVDALVDGQPVRFLVDSGASRVVLSPKDAARLDRRVPAGQFTEIYSTPGGLVRAAPVLLDEIRIGELRMRNVRASVSERPMDVSLLGASFLGRLAGYEVSSGRMTLRW